MRQIQGHNIRYQETRLQREAWSYGSLSYRWPRNHRSRFDVSRHQAAQSQAARGMDDYGRPVLLVRNTKQNLFRQGSFEIIDHGVSDLSDKSLTKPNSCSNG